MLNLKFRFDFQQQIIAGLIKDGKLKEMQILQALTVNADIDSSFELALGKARKRVVVKRPAKAARLGNLKPDLVYREKTIRLDVYLTA